LFDEWQQRKTNALYSKPKNLVSSWILSGKHAAPMTRQAHRAALARHGVLRVNA